MNSLAQVVFFRSLFLSWNILHGCLFLYVIVVFYVDGVGGGGVVWKTVDEAKRVDSIEIPHFNIINLEIALPGENWIGKRGAGA